MNPKDRFAAKKPKPNLSLVSPASLIYEALAMEDGARKYGPYNWRRTEINAMVYVAACLRHLVSWVDGEEKAEDSGVPHIAHAKACLGILADAIEGGHLLDDRPLKGPASRLLAPRVPKKPRHKKSKRGRAL